MKIGKYWAAALLVVLAVSSYPLYMGVRVVSDMAEYGTVSAANYPKYIIPYTPVSVAVIIAVLLMPLLIRYAERFAFAAASVLSVAVFFAAEFLLESQVVVTGSRITLENWQMYMCYVPPDAYEARTWTPVDVLMGEYSPAFKIHFYLISVILIITVLNCIYGFARVVRSGDRRRQKALIIQSVCTALFLGLCILACFTAFFRDGRLTVSALSAVLMSLFFVLLGVTTGIFAGSLWLGRKKLFSVVLPAAFASLAVLAMYIGEMCLLSGYLYRFGTGLFFEGIPWIRLAPADILIILGSGCITAFLCGLLNRQTGTGESEEE